VQTPLQVTYHATPHSDVLAAQIQRRADQLDRLCDRLISCRVSIELSGHHHSSGDRYRVCIHVDAPGHEFVVNHNDTSPRHPVADAEAATDRAFDEVDRQVEKWVKTCRSTLHESGHGKK
jgi:ribosome-associated translation inhibitor RaiA